MKKLVKTFFVSAVALVLTAATPLAYAQVNDTTVVNSGNDVDVQSSASQTSNINVINQNRAVVQQNVAVDANTGGNTANRNIGDTSVSTGNAIVNTNLNVDANSNATHVSGIDPMTMNFTDVVNTGDMLDVNTNTNTNTNVNVANQNLAAVRQNVAIDANTGDNRANRNIGGTSVDTGNVNVGTTADLVLNRNMTHIGDPMSSSSLFSSHDSLVNDTVVTNTGDDVLINSSANANTNVNVRNDNRTRVAQNVHVLADSGFNRANRNIGGSDTSTGNVGVNTDLMVAANANMTGIFHDPMSMGGMNFVDVVNTGDRLNSNTNVSSNQNTNIVSVEELLALQRHHEMISTGFNRSNRGIGGSSIFTGGTGTNTGFMVRGNLNRTFVGDFFDFFLGL